MTLVLARPASADLVYLTNGRVLSVDSWQVKDGVAVLVLRDGGQMEAPEALIAEVLPDEYVRTKPTPAARLAEADPVVVDPQGIRAMVDAAALRHGVDVKLARAVVKVESDFQTRAVSPKGAKGLMQLMPSVAKQYAVADPFNPGQNLDAGLRHLRALLDRFRDVSTALAAYNAGLFAVAKYGGIPPYRETQDYVRRIMAMVR